MLVITKQRHFEGRTREVGDIYEVSESRARQLGSLVAPYNGGTEAAVMPPDGPPADKAMKRSRKVKVKDGSGQ